MIYCVSMLSLHIESVNPMIRVTRTSCKDFFVQSETQVYVHCMLIYAIHLKMFPFSVCSSVALAQYFANKIQFVKGT